MGTSVVTSTKLAMWIHGVNGGPSADPRRSFFFYFFFSKFIVDLREPSRTSMDLCGPPRSSVASMDLHRPPWTCADLHGPPWISVASTAFADLRGPLRTSADLCGPLRTFADPHESSRTSTDLLRPCRRGNFFFIKTKKIKEIKKNTIFFQILIWTSTDLMEGPQSKQQKQKLRQDISAEVIWMVPE